MIAEIYKYYVKRMEIFIYYYYYLYVKMEKNKYIKISKIDGIERLITKKEALKLIGNAFVYSERILENSTKLNPINLPFCYIYKK